MNGTTGIRNDHVPGSCSYRNFNRPCLVGCNCNSCVLKGFKNEHLTPKSN